MDQIIIGQILELEDQNQVCIHFVERPSLIVPKKDLGNFKIGEFILCKLFENRKHNMRVKKVYTFKKTQIGKIVFEQKESFVEINHKEGKTRIPCKPFPNLYEGAKVRFRLENQTNAIIYTILEQEKEDTEIIDLAERMGLPTIFPKKVIKQASMLKEPTRIERSRFNLTNQEIFTIDGRDSKDFDDAISLREENGNYILGTHIADVGYYVKEGSPLDLEARKRGMTAYFLNCVIPMLPESLSNGICSLKEHVYRYTLTHEMKISKSGEILDAACFLACIESKKRMTYEDTNLVLNGQSVEGYRPFKDTLQEMYRLAEKLYAQRMREGAIEFNQSDPEFVLDQNGKMIDIYPRKRGKSEFIIQEFMLASNRSVASMLHKEGLIYPHRIHLEPDFIKLKSLEPKLNSLGVSIEPIWSAQNQSLAFNFILEQYRSHKNYPLIADLLISCMRRAKYTTDDLGHFGLGLPRNVHFTSPIRRYPDLVVHRIIHDHYLQQKPQTEDEIEDLELLSFESTRAEKRIVRCEEQVIARKSKEYLLSHIGETMDAVVKDCTEKGILIELKNCIEDWILNDQIEGTYHDGHYTFANSSLLCQLGTHLKVKLVKQNHLPDVSFQIVESNMAKTYHLKSRKKMF